MIELILISIVINSMFFLSYDKISECLGLYDLPDNSRKIHFLKVSNIGGFIFAINALVFLLYSYFFKVFLKRALYFLFTFSLLFLFLLVFVMIKTT